MSHIDGFALEGVFRKVRLDCKQFDDPAMQLALLLHNSQTANEVFLLSLRDCVVTLPKGHPLKDWVSQQKNLQNISESAKGIQQKLEGKIKNIWSSEHALKPNERQILIQLLDELDELPPYLDYTLLRAVGYLKLGNWVRTEKILAEWLERDPIERIRITPLRNDLLGKFTLGIVEDLFQSLARGLKGRVIVDVFFQGILEFSNQEELIEEATKAQEMDLAEILSKLNLRYHQNLVPGFAGWLQNRELRGARYMRFMEEFFNEKDFADRVWIFLGRLPVDAQYREKLAQTLPALKEKNPVLFHALAEQEDLRGVLVRVAPASAKNLLKERRHLYLKRFNENEKDTWALSQLVELGQIDEALVEKLARP
ncbi:MAG: hypothetical protein ACLGG0_06695 [Bacteriovoracia bacterium]